MSQYKYTYEGQEYNSEWALRRAMPYVSLPKVLDDEILARYNITKEEIPTPTTDLPTARRLALSRMEEEFNLYSDSKDSYITSSLGFNANCRYRAFMDVSGLVLQAKNADVVAQAEDGSAEPATVTFMDFEDQPHQLTASQLETLALEISKNGTRAYGVKWAYRSALEAAETIEEITEITTQGFDFRPDDQKPASVVKAKARTARKKTTTK